MEIKKINERLLEQKETILNNKLKELDRLSIKYSFNISAKKYVPYIGITVVSLLTFGLILLFDFSKAKVCLKVNDKNIKKNSINIKRSDTVKDISENNESNLNNNHQYGNVESELFKILLKNRINNKKTQGFNRRLYQRKKMKQLKRINLGSIQEETVTNIKF